MGSSILKPVSFLLALYILFFGLYQNNKSIQERIKENIYSKLRETSREALGDNQENFDNKF